MKKYTFIDLFAGAGGLSLGLEQAGFTPCFVNEIVQTYSNTYKANRDLPDERYYIGDINTLNEHFEEYAHLMQGATLVCGGPPCQGFSMANRQRIIDDPRNQLYKAYLTFLSRVRPQFFIMENVKGMANKIDEIKQNFREFLGDEYLFDYELFKAQDYGVPQNRERLIFIGNCPCCAPSRSRGRPDTSPPRSGGAGPCPPRPDPSRFSVRNSKAHSHLPPSCRDRGGRWPQQQSRFLRGTP